MPLISKKHTEIARVLRPFFAVALLLVLSLLGGACMTPTTGDAPKSQAKDSGIKFPHDKHVGGDLGVECSACHDTSGDTTMPALAMPGHELCALCHELPEGMDGEMTPELLAKEECNFCHSRPDRSVDLSLARLTDEIKFTHARHSDAGVACESCHTDINGGASLPKGSLKPFCMDCHGKKSAELNNCAVCHNTMDKGVIPATRGGKEIAHNAPWIWETQHGREAQVDPMYCALCHDQQEHCDDCHSRVEPKDHTLAWRNRTHGLRAAWDRNKCAVCHEEDSCQKCHENMEPQSHRAGWGDHTNTHCVSCHYPPEQNGCVVCHENIEHRGALPSPHLLGVYPPNCAACHPGGLPNRAPHLMNSSVHCTVCHN